jgi:hypothetical protein
MPTAGATFPCMVRKVIGCTLVALAFPVLACEMPDEGNMPLRRAATRVEMQPEVEAWARATRRSGANPQFVVRIDAPHWKEERGASHCYWPVEVRADGRLWRRYLVTPDGRQVLPTE